MKVVVKSPLNDLFSFILHLKRRKKFFRKGSKERLPEGQMNILARQLHPKQQIFVIDNIRFENETINGILESSLTFMLFLLASGCLLLTPITILSL